MVTPFQPTRRRSTSNPFAPTRPTPTAVPDSHPPRLLSASSSTLPLRASQIPNPYIRPTAPPSHPSPLPSPQPNPYTCHRAAHAIKALHNLDQLFNFMLQKRGEDETKRFADACWVVYNDKFSRSKRRPSHPHPSTPHNPSSSNSSTHPPPQLPSVPPPTRHSDTDVIDVDAPDPQSPPSASPVQSFPLFPQPPCPAPHHFHPLVKQRLSLFEAVLERSKCFSQISASLITPPYPQPVNVWPLQNTSDHVTITYEDMCPAMCDTPDSFSPVHLNALRFLWYYLLENPCSGAIFNHGIAYPKSHLVYMLALLVKKSPVHRQKSILIVVPLHALEEWRRAKTGFELSVTVNELPPDAWTGELTKWKRDGGVLLLSDDQYTKMITERDNELRINALLALSRPGPAIVIFDEAARLCAEDQFGLMRRVINRTQTKARLALTSVPLAGNVSRAWSVLNFACPKLFGTQAEFWAYFVKPLVEGLTEESTPHTAKRSLAVAKLLHQSVAHITCTIDLKQRKDAIRNKGYVLKESTINVVLPEEEMLAYQEVEVILNEALSRNAVSSFVAAHLLICCATSVRSLREVLINFMKMGEPILKQYKIEEQSQALRELSEKLINVTENYMRLPSTKILVTRAIANECVKREERLVVFASCAEVQMEAYEVLNNYLKSPTRIVFNYDVRDNLAGRDKQRHSFNTHSSGAVLLAPYGPTVDCMEDAGWGFINATRVLFLDTTWHIPACIQAIHRVYNFAQLNQAMHVHHFVAEDTIEVPFFFTLSARHNQYSHHVADDIPFNPVRFPEGTGFLLPSVIPRKWIRRSQDQPVPANPPQEVTIERRGQATQETSSESSALASDAHESLLVPVQQIRGDNGGLLISKVTWNTNRYEVMSEVLDICVGLNGENYKHDLSTIITALPIVSQSTPGVTVSSLLDDAVRRLDRIGNKGPDNSEFPPLIADQFFLEPEVSVCHLLSCWNMYRRLFECFKSDAARGDFDERQSKRRRVEPIYIE